MIVSASQWTVVVKKLERLFQESFGKMLPEGYLDWRYMDGGKSNLLFSTHEDDLGIVASYSAFPLDFVCDGKLYSTAMSMTTMTHPDWRGKGLFQKLATELYSYAESQNISLIWGFPNGNSHSTFCNKLGWGDIYEIPTMSFFAEEVLSGIGGGSAGIQRDDAFLLNYELPPKDGLLRVNKTREYLQWRYYRNPTAKYSNHVICKDGVVSSYIVSKLYGDGVDLVDIQVFNAQDARKLLEYILGQGIELGATKVFCWAPTHDMLHSVLERIGFVNTEPITYFGAKVLNKADAPLGCFDFKKWYIQMGDSDVY